ncbi:type VI immunity family protein [Corallococcus silvisoli]|uniref:type VI immunity family protein n=1 Tax=Corallococcus silvisoli TaxID=2697031 RepID=UPI002E2BBFFF|nr:type VI immunity family protein [Corallococcus silvisoli]
MVSFFVHRPPEEVAPAIWRALRTYLRAIPPGALGWYVSEEGEMAPLDDTGWENVRQHLLESPWNGVGAIELWESPSEAGSYHFEYYGRRINDPVFKDPITSVSFTFPTEYLVERGTAHLRTLALELARELPFSFGYASPAIISPQGLFGMGDWSAIEALMARYLGLDAYHTREFSSVIGTHALGAYWLTFLGQPLLGQLGGVEALRQALPDTSLLPLEDERLLITLGEWPDAIDTEKAAVPSPYRALASLLSPCLFEYTGDLNGFERLMNQWHKRLCP